MKIIELIISPSGRLTINAAGFQGPDCEQATAFLEQALGQAGHKQRKPEYYQQSYRKKVQRLGQ
jgi:hypothetical protein